MKYPASLPAVVTALCLSAPATGLTHDHDKHHHDSGNCHASSSYGNSYCPLPGVVAYRSYPSYYRSYPYSYGVYPYSYGPSFALSLSTTPNYYDEGSYYRGIQRSPGYDDDLSVDVQRALARRGYYRGAIDGDIGTGTRAAIRRYQYEHRLEVTGRIDRSLLRSLGLA